jgi:orotidine-5'-phosphate decarboxylase
MTFYEKLERAWRQTGSMVCVGLDPQEDRLPTQFKGSKQPFFDFNRAIIEATQAHACAFKPQFAHYAGAGRLDELAETCRFIRETCPGHLLILDAKRGDIGNTAAQYAREAFDVYGADTVTVNPYMGGDTLRPFSDRQDRGLFVLCKTSNPGSSDLQDLVLSSGNPLYLEVARKAVEEWNGASNLALVVGATYPETLRSIRGVAPEMPILVPGIGAQGGDLAGTLEAGLREDGWGLLINSSRAIIHASSESDFAEAASRAAAELAAACQDLQQRKAAQ